MKKNKNVVIVSLFLSLGLMLLGPGKIHAEDVDVYRTSVKNNAMLVVDTSGSMAWPVYNHEIDYRAFWDWATGVSPVNASPLSYDDDSGDTHKDIENWEKNRIYLASAYLGHEEITGSRGEQYSVFGDPMYDGRRERFIYGGIIDTGWTYTDLDDPDSGVTIETLTDSEGKKWVVYPSAVPAASGVTKDVNKWNEWVYYTDNAQAGVTFFNNQAVRLTDVRVDPRTNVAKDHGFLGYMKAPGIYFAGLFADGGLSADLALTDKPSDAQTLSGLERVYGFVTGNYLSFLKIVEDMKTNSQDGCSSDQYAWEKQCYKPDSTEPAWTTVGISTIKNSQYNNDYSSNRNENRGTINLAGFGGPKSVKIYFSTLDIENRTIPGCSCSNNNSNNDGAYFEDQDGNRLTMVTNPESGIYETIDGKLYGCDANGKWTGEYNVDGVTSITVKFFVGPNGGDNCDGSDSGFRITKIQYSYAAAGSAPGTPETGGVGFTCCNGSDNVGYKIQSRLETAVEAIKVVLDDTEDKINWGLMSFSGSSGGTLRNQLGSSITSIKTSLDNLSANGGTPMGEAMQDAYDAAYSYLQSNATTAGCANNFMVVMTDGFPSNDDSWARINSQGAGTNPNFSSGSQNDGDTWGGDPTQGQGGVANYSDDVARWMHEGAGVDADAIDADYLYTTHTIGFSLESPLLQNVADDGGGISITAQDRTELINAFYSLGLLMSTSVSFTAPVVSVDEANRTQSGDRLYMAFFKPASGELWQGNLKKYGLSYTTYTDCGRTEPEFLVVDKNGNPAGECDGLFKSTSVSYWSQTADGGAVAQGGTGALLKDAMPGDHVVDVPSTGPYYDFRNIYTYSGVSIVRFYRDGDSGVSDTITAEDLGVSSVTDYPVPNRERDKIINFVYGYTYDTEEDADPTSYDEDTEGDPVAKRSWILGDIIHSEPTVIDYQDPSNNLVHRFIAIGANDGMLHVFTDQDITLGSTTYTAGSEIWAFIPSDLLTKLKELQDPNTHSYFVDGFVSLHRDSTRNANAYYYKTLVFGERRGGRSYWALDVSDPDPSQWTVKWHLEGDVFSNELGYSWSRPTFTRIRTGSGTTDFTDVVVFGGGYDLEEDNYPEPWDDNDNDGVYEPLDGETYTDENGNSSYDYYNPDKNDTGRGIFVVNLSDGSHRFAATYALADSTSGTSQQYTDMKWSFPADPTVINLGSELLVYMADVYGQIWKVTYNYHRSPQQWVVKRIFQANPGSDQPNVKPTIDTAPALDNTDYGRKVFYSPDVSYLGTDWTDYPVLYLGTGDRAHPRYVPGYHNRFYSFSDTDTLADETNLLNLTCDELDDNADVDQDGDVDIDDDTARDDVWDILYGATAYSGGISRGWYRIMGKQGDCTQDSTDHQGEMILSRPVLFFGTVFFTSYQAVFDDPCNPNGNAYIYALDYSKGTAALDLNIDNPTLSTLSDTFRVVQNSSIASGVRIITRGGEAAGLVSAGGSVVGAGEEEASGTGHSSTIPGPPGGVSKILWEAY